MMKRFERSLTGVISRIINYVCELSKENGEIIVRSRLIFFSQHFLEFARIRFGITSVLN